MHREAERDRQRTVTICDFVIVLLNGKCLDSRNIQHGNVHNPKCTMYIVSIFSELDMKSAKCRNTMTTNTEWYSHTYPQSIYYSYSEDDTIVFLFDDISTESHISHASSALPVHCVWIRLQQQIISFNTRNGGSRRGDGISRVTQCLL